MKPHQANVGDLERLVSVTLGALLLTSARGRSLPVRAVTVATGASLLQRGLTGFCYLYKTTGLSTAEVLSLPRRFGDERTIAINIPPGELIKLVRHEMSRLLGVDTPIPVDGGAGDMLTFRSGSLSGTVKAWASPEPGVSYLRVALVVDAGSSLLSRAAQKVARSVFPYQHLEEALRRFKMWAETGEVATTALQTHGRRTVKGQMMQDLLQSIASRPASGSRLLQVTPMRAVKEALIHAGRVSGLLSLERATL